MKTSKTLHNYNQNTNKSSNTFIVKIEFCQHETWQGKGIWGEENKAERVRSALELVRIMDEAMAGGAEIQFQEAKTS